MFRNIRRAFGSVLLAGALLFSGTAVAAGQPAANNETTVAAAATDGSAPNGVIIVMLLAFALGWAAMELRRA